MAAFTGMNIEQVRALAEQMRSASEQIESIANQLTSATDNATWEGPDANQFRSEWSGTHKPSLSNLCQVLITTSEAAKRNAAEQEQASA